MAEASFACGDPLEGSAEGGKTAAVLYSVVGTCKHLGIDPFAYLRDVLPGLRALREEPGEESLVPWLPDAWQQQQRAGTTIGASAKMPHRPTCPVSDV